MFRDTYIITLREPCLLLDNTGTENNIRSLEFIPGNIFRGLVAAKLYNTYRSNEVIDLFHNGSVRYHDANPIIHNNRTWRIPAAWHTRKGFALKAGQATFYSSVLTNSDNTEKLDTNEPYENVSGYFTTHHQPDGASCVHYGSPEYGISLKSRHNADTGTSMDAHLFMYKYLRAGQQFMLYISSERADLLEIIRNTLDDTYPHIGKSRRNEYGRAHIKCISQIEPLDNAIIPESTHDFTFYADSDLCFLGNFGEYTTQLTPSHFGLSSGNIDYVKSRLTIRRYYPFNHKRRTHDPERIVIGKGSVVCINDARFPAGFKYPEGAHTIGVHRSEGLGHVLINAPWLIGRSPDCFNAAKIDRVDILPHFSPKADPKNDISTKCINLLEIIRTTKNKEMLVENALNDFREEASQFKNLKSSQWGRLYSECMVTSSTDEQEDILQIIIRPKEGKRAEKWRNSADQLHAFLIQDKKWKLHPLLLKRISREMQKGGLEPSNLKRE